MTDDNAANAKIIDFPNLQKLPVDNSWITIGNFDGVHRGHQYLINNLVEKAQREGNPVIVVTFFPNPTDFFQPNTALFYLSTPAEKETLLCQMGVDRVITFRFDRDFANLSAFDFLFALKDKLGLRKLVVGEDFVLGKDRQGSLPVIKSIGDTLDFSMETVSPLREGGEAISSTRIRRCLDEGDLTRVKELLGRAYRISGVVTRGSDRGARIGLPTANMTHWVKQKLPAIGVYATRVLLHEKIYYGITNVGLRPTFEDQTLPNIETHILDFDGNIYGEQLKVEFIQKIRDEQKFSGVDAFLAQIARDKATARRIFNDDQP